MAKERTLTPEEERRRRAEVERNRRIRARARFDRQQAARLEASGTEEGRRAAALLRQNAGAQAGPRGGAFLRPFGITEDQAAASADLQQRLARNFPPDEIPAAVTRTLPPQPTPVTRFDAARDAVLGQNIAFRRSQRRQPLVSDIEGAGPPPTSDQVTRFNDVPLGTLTPDELRVRERQIEERRRFKGAQRRIISDAKRKIRQLEQQLASTLPSNTGRKALLNRDIQAQQARMDRAVDHLDLPTGGRVVPGEEQPPEAPEAPQAPQAQPEAPAEAAEAPELQAPEPPPLGAGSRGAPTGRPPVPPPEDAGPVPPFSEQPFGEGTRLQEQDEIAFRQEQRRRELSPRAQQLGGSMLLALSRVGAQTTGLGSTDPALMGPVRSFLRGDTTFLELPQHLQNAIRSQGLLPEVLQHQRQMQLQAEREAFRDTLRQVADQSGGALALDPLTGRLRPTAEAELAAQGKLTGREGFIRRKTPAQQAADARALERRERTREVLQQRALERREANLRTGGSIARLRELQQREGLQRGLVEAQQTAAQAQLVQQLNQQATRQGTIPTPEINQNALASLTETVGDPNLALQILSQAAQFGFNPARATPADLQQLAAIGRAQQEINQEFFNPANPTSLFNISGTGGLVETADGRRFTVSGEDAPLIEFIRDNAQEMKDNLLFTTAEFFIKTKKGADRLKRGIRRGIDIIEELGRVQDETTRKAYAGHLADLVNRFGSQPGRGPIKTASGLVQRAFQDIERDGAVGQDTMARLRRALNDLPSVIGR